MNAGETDVDCGGPCAPCDAQQGCEGAPDCASGVCAGGACAAPSCTDAVRNGDESGVDCGGATCAPCDIGIGCTSGSECETGVCLDGSCDCGDSTGVYVSSSTGDDANPGTAAAPLASIQAAVACLFKVPREIRVAEGLYEGSGASRIALVEGKSLVGGWSTDFAQRSPAEHPSEIRDTTDTGTDTSHTGVAVLLSSTSTATVLDGFTIRATTTGAGNLAIAAIALAVSPPPGRIAGATVRNNVLECGGNADIFLARCVDLGTSGGNIVVEDNTIHLGTSDPANGTSRGIEGYSVSDVAIVRNRFDGGSSSKVIPIELWVAPSASLLVAGNEVRPGGAGPAGIQVQLMSSAATPAIRNNVVVVAGGAIGIDDAAGSEISNNTVIAATGAGIRTSVAGASIRNNAIAMQSSGTCLADATTSGAPDSIRNNDLYGCAKLYVEGASAPLLSVAEVNTLSMASGNISADPLLDAANAYRPLAGSPLLGAGLDLSSLFQTDRLGAARTAPWSIGAYEDP